MVCQNSEGTDLEEKTEVTDGGERGKQLPVKRTAALLPQRHRNGLAAASPSAVPSSPLINRRRRLNTLFYTLPAARLDLPGSRCSMSVVSPPSAATTGGTCSRDDIWRHFILCIESLSSVALNLDVFCLVIIIIIIIINNLFPK